MPPKRKRVSTPSEFIPMLGDLSPLEEFGQRALPSRRDVLRHFLHHFPKNSKDQAAKFVVEKLFKLHGKSPTRKTAYNLELDVKKLYQSAR